MPSGSGPVQEKGWANTGGPPDGSARTQVDEHLALGVPKEPEDADKFSLA